MTRQCRVCGGEFEPRSHTSLTCSPECRREVARRKEYRKRHHGAEPPERGRAWRRWTEEDDRRLTWLWGEASIAVMTQALDRTAAAVRSRADTLGLGPSVRGGLALQDLERISGYSRGVIHRAAARLGIVLGRCHALRTGRRIRPRRYVIDQDDADRILDWLRSGHAGRPNHQGREAA